MRKADFNACMASLIAQTWSAPEIIIVNDGSTDHSVEIAKHYANITHMFDCFIRPMLAHSSPVIFACKQRPYDYVAFVDGDDPSTRRCKETLMTMALIHLSGRCAQCNATGASEKPGTPRQSIPTDRLRSTGVLRTGLSRMALARDAGRMLPGMGVYRRALIDNNIYFRSRTTSSGHIMVDGSV
ncbi:glycosyltransferase [Salmonella enterica subsp. enterica]|nr:glycosyltransferase [Salmonella enterica subsp. enterica]